MNHKMPSESKPLLTAQTEKPNHYSYLKEFRVDQCPLFLQHKCTQHRPYTCFHWHFMNQRRRRPVRKRDGSFNYSADNYCTKFDETTGLCPEGDDCPYLHRTAGDTERRYHLRYYKTCMCVHDTDARGYCVKNGPHCAFAHGNHDLRPPVYDIKEIQALENPDGDSNATPNGPNVLDKERNLMNEDPKWQDSAYVLSNYKTEPCKRPPRLCRQGYACPQYHNSRDKRRSPKKFKYRSTPCPNVKHGDEWGEPGNCESGDLCAYCHTRTEQQFHPEIYKSTKCNDVQQSGYCPRGAFCAFAHIDQEMSVAREADTGTGTNLAEILSNVLPPDSKKEDQKSDSSNGSGEASESASISSLGSNGSNKAPGAQLSNSNKLTQSIYNNHSLHSNDIFNNSLLQQQQTQQQILAIEKNPLLEAVEKVQRKQSLYFANVHSNGILGSFYSTDPVDSIVGAPLDDLSIDDPLNLVATIENLESDSPNVSNSISAGLANSGLLGSSAPVNIPGSGINDRSSSINFSPTASSPLNHLNFLTSSRFAHQEQMDTNTSFMGQSHLQSKMGNFQSTGIYDFSQNMSSPHHPVSHSPLVSNFITSSSPGTLSNNEIQRLQNELLKSKQQLVQWEQMVSQARTACEAWQRDAEDNSRKANIAEKQRDEALSQAKSLQKEVESLQKSPYLHGLRRVSELRTLPIPTLKQLQAQLRSDLEQIDEVIYLQTATKCMVCEERNRSVTLGPCNHYVLCNKCAPNQKECPYCQTPIQNPSNLNIPYFIQEPDFCGPPNEIPSPSQF